MEQLPGGFVTEVVRVGDTVRRRPPANAGFVHDLLCRLARPGAAAGVRAAHARVAANRDRLEAGLA